MQDRLLELIKDKSMTLGAFAKSIGVQPSAISHIISGRNKPGFDFISQVLIRYPEIDPKWFILGNGEMYADKRQSLHPPAGNNEQKTIFDTESEVSNTTVEVKNVRQDKSEVERVIIFYSDGTFREYINNK